MQSHRSSMVSLIRKELSTCYEYASRLLVLDGLIASEDQQTASLTKKRILALLHSNLRRRALGGSAPNVQLAKATYASHPRK